MALTEPMFLMMAAWPEGGTLVTAVKWLQSIISCQGGSINIASKLHLQCGGDVYKGTTVYETLAAATTN